MRGEGVWTKQSPQTSGIVLSVSFQMKVLGDDKTLKPMPPLCRWEESKA